MLDKKDKKKSKTKELEILASTNLAGWQKALADYQNLQKETEKKLGQVGDFTRSAVILELLPIFDNYRIAINHIPDKQKQESWAVGLEHILKQWDSFLDNYQISKIKTLGETLDTQWHEAVGEVNLADKEDQEIIEEKLGGYKLKDMVIRPAKVIINNKK